MGSTEWKNHERGTEAQLNYTVRSDQKQALPFLISSLPTVKEKEGFSFLSTPELGI